MSNKIYDKNIEALKERFFNIVKMIEESNSDDHKTEVEADAVDVDGRKCLTAVKNGKYIQLESLYDNAPMLDAFFSWTDEEWQLDGIYLMFGFGNGMYAREYLRRTSPDHNIFIVEPSLKLFIKAIENYDLTDLFKNKRFFVVVIEGDGTKDYKVIFDNIIEYTDIFAFKYGIYPNYDELFEKELLTWDDQLMNRFRRLYGSNHLIDIHGTDFIKNNYTAFRYAARSRSLIDLIRVMPDDIPTIIVSAGPSLAKNMNELKQAKGRSLIIAVDAAVNPLVKNGIIPDINICVDPSKGEEYIAETGAEQIPLICGMNAGRGLIEARKGELLYFADDNAFTKRFFDKHSIKMLGLSTGGSVSNNAFSLALALKAKRIIFVGQDLAYTNDESHAKGSIRGTETLNDLEGEIIEDIDIYGNPVKTGMLFKIFKLWFETQIEMFPDIRVIDATEGGALIKGTEIMTLYDAIDRECTKPFDFGAILSQTKYLFDEVQEREFYEYISSLPSKLINIKKEISDGKNSYAKIKKLAKEMPLNNKKIVKESRTANEILTSIQNDEASEYLKYLIQHYTNEMLSTINNIQSDTRKELEEISNIGTAYLTKLDEAIDELLTIIDEYGGGMNLPKE